MSRDEFHNLSFFSDIPFDYSSDGTLSSSADHLGFQDKDSVRPQGPPLQTGPHSPQHITKEDNYIGKHYELKVFVDLKFRILNLDFCLQLSHRGNWGYAYIKKGGGGGRHGSVRMVTRWTVSGSIWVRAKRFFASAKHSDRLWGAPSLLITVHRVLSDRGKAAGVWSWPAPST
jgi:hypothetical protein